MITTGAIRYQRYQGAWPAIYRKILCEVNNNGAVTAPRGQQTREVVGTKFLIHSPGFCFLDIPGRNLNYAFGLRETLMALAGQRNMATLELYSKNAVAKMQVGGLYGPRLRAVEDHHGNDIDQIAEVIRRLKTDPDSRQAFISMWLPHDNISSQTYVDRPCNTTFQFLLRQEKLHVTVQRRSSDIIWGLPYDHLLAQCLQACVAAELDCKCGSIIEFTGSLHYYQNFYEKSLKSSMDWMQTEKLGELLDMPLTGVPASPLSELDLLDLRLSEYENSLIVNKRMSDQLRKDLDKPRGKINMWWEAAIRLCLAYLCAKLEDNKGLQLMIHQLCVEMPLGPGWGVAIDQTFGIHSSIYQNLPKEMRQIISTAREQKPSYIGSTEAELCLGPMEVLP